MSIFVTTLFFVLWAVIPTLLEGLETLSKVTSAILALPSLWMLVIWVDRLMLSRKEGRPA